MDKDQNISWDTMDPNKREHLLLQEVIKSTLFAKKNVPFYISYLSKFSDENIQNIASLEEYAFTIPETTRSHLSNNSHTAFLPIHHQKIIMDKATGGTTNHPIVICFTEDDKKLAAKTIARSILFDFKDNKDELKKLKVLGLYHGDHITNHLLRTTFESLDIEFFDRISSKNIIKPNYIFYVDAKANSLLGPPESQLHKGISIASFLKYDASTSNKAQFKALFWSSGPFSDDLYDYVKSYLKIPYIKGLYGSTEVALIGSTCSELKDSFHLDYFPVLTLLKKSTSLATNGDEGYLVVSKTGFSEKTATVLLNYRNGDTAILNTNKCRCKRTTPIISNVQRKDDKIAKSIFGCEVD